MKCENCDRTASRVAWRIEKLSAAGDQCVVLCPHCALRALQTAVGMRVVASIERARPMTTEGHAAAPKKSRGYA